MRALVGVCVSRGGVRVDRGGRCRWWERGCVRALDSVSLEGGVMSLCVTLGRRESVEAFFEGLHVDVVSFDRWRALFGDRCAVQFVCWRWVLTGDLHGVGFADDAEEARVHRPQHDAREFLAQPLCVEVAPHREPLGERVDFFEGEGDVSGGWSGSCLREVGVLKSADVVVDVVDRGCVGVDEFLAYLG